MANAVSSSTATLAFTFARPLSPVHVVPSRKMIVTDAPGIPRRARSRSRAAWRRSSIETVVTLGRERPSPGSRSGAGRALGAGDGATVADGNGDAAVVE